MNNERGNVLCQSLFRINDVGKTIYLTKKWRKGQERKKDGKEEIRINNHIKLRENEDK
jgi:hypothetical protein